MQNEINTILEVRDVIAHHGRDLVIGTAVIVVGLIAIKWINKGLKKGLIVLAMPQLQIHYSRENILDPIKEV